MKEIDRSKPVLVTGASGFIASWIVKLLLEEGLTVHGTVRDKSRADKVAHLTRIAEETPGVLRFFEADLLDEGSFKAAMEGCELVVHTASPFFVQGVKDAQKELIEPALQGTRNVLNSATETESVKRIVLTSSVAAIYGDNIEVEDKPNGQFTEKDWNTSSDLEHQPYSYSKTLAEKEAWAMAEEQSRWDLVVINPSFVLGPSLSERTDSTSTGFVLSMVNGQFKAGAPELYFGIVDVRDVAQAHFDAGFRPQASGRHIVSNEVLSLLEMSGLLREEFNGRYPLPKSKLPKFLLYLFGPFQGFSWKYVSRNVGIPARFDNSYGKADLGLEYRPVRDTLVDQVRQLEEKGMIGA